MRTGTMGRATHGIAILALLLAGFGTDAAVTSNHVSGGHASAHHQVHHHRPGRMSDRPWMY
jgi:hypothetical protein